MRETALFLGALAAAGCTFEKGEPFGLVEATAQAEYEPSPDRDQGGGWQKLDTEYEVRVDEARATLDAVELHGAASSDDAPAGFDPANPPAGYSLCHNGHCHRGDGALVSYADVAAEIAGGVSGGPVLALAVPASELDLLAPAPLGLSCGDACVQPESQLVLARMTVSRLDIAGSARGGLPGQELAGDVPLRVALDIVGRDDAPVFDTALDVTFDDEAPPIAKIGLDLVLGSRVFDGIDLGALDRASDGAIELSAALNPEALTELVAKLTESAALFAAVERAEP